MEIKFFKILVDENLSKKLLPFLNFAPESKHVISCALEHTNDIDIWNFAKTNDYTILTRDIDFYGLSTLYGCPPKVIHLVTPKTNQSTKYFHERITSNLQVIIEFLKSEVYCYLEIK